MTIQVDFNPETEAHLIAKVRLQGVPLEKLAERLLKEGLTASLPPHGVLRAMSFSHDRKHRRRFCIGTGTSCFLLQFSYGDYDENPG